MSPSLIVQAHQYLYYVRAAPIWSDYDYDLFCDSHGIPGGGGSDRAIDYGPEVVALACRMLTTPSEFPPSLER